MQIWGKECERRDPRDKKIRDQTLLSGVSSADFETLMIENHRSKKFTLLAASYKL